VVTTTACRRAAGWTIGQRSAPDLLGVRPRSVRVRPRCDRFGVGWGTRPIVRGARTGEDGSMTDVGDVGRAPAEVDETSRQRVENQLLDASAGGRLTEDEYDRRTRAAVEATSADQLLSATRDIPATGTRTDDPTAETDAASAGGADASTSTDVSDTGSTGSSSTGTS